MSYTLAEIREIPIFFIVGKGRSGTTLLSNILDGHPNVASATESRFVLMIWQKYKHLKSWKTEQAETFYEDILKDFSVKYLWKMDKTSMLEQLRALPEETKAEDLIKLVYLFRISSFPKEKISFIIDKNPMYTIFVERLMHIFKEAKFIRVVRDPRDNVTSHIKFTKKDVNYLAYKWLKYNEHIDRIASKWPDKFLTLNFENLILDKVGFFKEIENFTGIKSLIAHEGKRLDYKDKIEEKFTERLRDQHQSSVKPMDPKKIGHYKQKLNVNQVRIIDAICFPYSNRYNYIRELEPQKLNSFVMLKTKLSYQFHVAFNLIIFNLPFKLIVSIYGFFIKYFLLKKKDMLADIKKHNA